MLNSLKTATNVAYTANGAKAYATTQSSLLDLFAQGGALRNRREAEILSLFTKAFAEDNLLALKMLFYFRDVRGGQGERTTFKTILRYMANNHTEVIAKNLSLIPFYGRWDDLYTLVGTKLESAAFSLITRQFRQDIHDEHPSLLGKWLKSENASSFETKKFAKKTRESLDLTPRQYRKALSSLRAKIAIVETQMSSNDWNIDYAKLPSQAGMRYRQAFYRHDEEGYTGFLGAVVKGEATINTKTLYPYEIVRQILSGQMVASGSRYNVGLNSNVTNSQALDVLWNNLPNYFGEDAEDSICVVDTSGSMRGLPIEIAISLGIYTAERNLGRFKDHFITFSDRPQIVEIQGTGIVEKVQNLSRANWDMNTNLEAVFELILKVAVDENLPQEQLIKRLFIISDMQFDSCVRGGNNITLFDNIRLKYANAGYVMPDIVFWNVNATTAQFPSTMTATGVQLVSGASPSIFTNLLKGSILTAYELMLNVLNSERYSDISV